MPSARGLALGAALLASLNAGQLSAATPAPVATAPITPFTPTPPAFLNQYLAAEPDGQKLRDSFVSAVKTLVTNAGGRADQILPHVLLIEQKKDAGGLMLQVQALAQAMLGTSLETTFNYPVELSAAPATAVSTAPVPPCQVTQSCRTADPLAPEHYLGPSAVAWPLGTLQTSPRANDLMTSMGANTTVAIIDAPPIAAEPTGELPPRVRGYDIGPATSALGPGHGTQVASVLFGQHNGQYSEGVAPAATRHQYGVGIPDLGSATSLATASMLLSDVLILFEGLDSPFTAPDVLSMSAGLPFGFTPLRDVIGRLSNRGVLMFFAAGNESANDCLYPARYNFPNSVCVGATGVVLATGQVDSYQPATYSNRGVDIALPGTGIPVPRVDAAGVLVRDAFGNLIYDPLDGTSFATPHAAGLAARILSELRANPGRYPQVAGLSRPEIAGYVRNLLFTRTTDVGSVGFDRETGHGIPDLAAIFEQLQADATPSAFQMKQTIQEWNDPTVFGNPFLSQYLARTQASNPLTRIALNYTFSRGSCASTSGKLSIDKPKLDVSIAAFQGAITSMTADTVTMDVSYDLRVPVRIEIDYLLPFVTCVLPIPIHVTVTGDWRSPQTGYTNTMRVVFKLDGEGYRAEDVSITGPETKQIFVGYSGVPAIFNSFLSQYDTQLREFATPAVQLFEEGVNDHVVQMLERMLNGTLSAERQEPFDYFRFRRPEPQGNLPLSLEYFTTRDRHDHLAAIGSNQSVFPVIASGLPGMTATSPVPDPTLGANPADVAQAIEKNTYGFELDYLWRSGVFDSITNDQLMAAIRTTTESQPDGANAVSVRVDNVLLVAPPALVPDRSVPGFFGRLQLIAVADVTVDNDPPSTVVFIYAPFVSEYSMFKEYARESDFTTFPLDLRWEDRLVVDPFQVAPANAQPVFELLGFPEVPSQVDPTLPVISTAEVSEVMRATILSEYHRALGSMSTKRLGLDARLGEGWGCFAPVVDFVNQYAQQLTGNDFLKLRGIQGCWDLNLGVFGPERTTQVRELTDHLVQDDTLNPRRTPEDLVPTAANPTPFFMTHPRDARFQAAVLPVAYSATGSQPDFFYSVNGEWNTPPGAQTNMQAVEEVWQAVLRRAAGARFVYVPEKTAFAPGEKTTFELLGAARDSAPAQLEVGSCWVRFRVEFAHARQPFAAIGPSNTQPVAAENYAQTRVDTPNDAWQNIQACDGWGSGEPTEPVDPDLQVGN